MTALSRKLRRELSSLRAQVLSMALVIAAGLASFVALGGNETSLSRARDDYYERFRFGEVFASVSVAPVTILDRLRELPGVASLDARVVERARVLMSSLPLPVSARLISLDLQRGAGDSSVDLRAGSWPEEPMDALLFEPFARGHGIAVGDRLDVVFDGKLFALRVAGLATSPAEIFPMPPGELAPDPERFAVIWMHAESLASLAGRQGAFNDLSIRLDRTTPMAEATVIEALNRELSPYGGRGAFSRDQHASHLVLEGELSQLRSISVFVPVLFFAVGALLVQLVTNRHVELQRASIATLKALGYPNRRVASHYLALAWLVGLLGSALGLGLGWWLGDALTHLYARFFRIPGLSFDMPVSSAALAVLVAIASPVGGAVSAVVRVARLPPAVAMHAAPPTVQRRSWLDRPTLRRWLAPSLLMVLREFVRRPLHAGLSSLGVAFAVGLLVVGRWFGDATETLIDLQFFRAMTEDMVLTFEGPVDALELNGIASLPAILTFEPLRGHPAKARSLQHHRDVMVWGVDPSGMRHLIDRHGAPFPLPPSGVVVSTALADALGLELGDAVELEWLQGERSRVHPTVAGVADDLVGLQVYVAPTQLAELRAYDDAATGALVRLDPHLEHDLTRALRRIPRLASASTRSDLLRLFTHQTGEMMRTFTMVVTLFAITMAFGILDNHARVALSKRSRDLATMRVLGMTRTETSAVLIGELALHVWIALPLGLWLGRRLAFALASTVDPERFRMPLVVSFETISFAVGLTLVAFVLVAAATARRLNHLKPLSALEAGE